MHSFPVDAQVEMAFTIEIIPTFWHEDLYSHSLMCFTTDVSQPWTNYVNNGNKHLIVGADVRSEYSNIRYLHLIIGKAQKFVSGDKYDF